MMQSGVKHGTSLGMLVGLGGKGADAVIVVGAAVTLVLMLVLVTVRVTVAWAGGVVWILC